jgi:hypothetical protein
MKQAHGPIKKDKRKKRKQFRLLSKTGKQFFKTVLFIFIFSFYASQACLKNFQIFTQIENTHILMLFIKL